MFPCCGNGIMIKIVHQQVPPRGDLRLFANLENSRSYQMLTE